jgi:hypothetical protein
MLDNSTESGIYPDDWSYRLRNGGSVSTSSVYFHYHSGGRTYFNIFIYIMKLYR